MHTLLLTTPAAVDDDEFWKEVHPLRFGPLPNLQESVYVVGYPIGGDTVSQHPPPSWSLLSISWCAVHGPGQRQVAWRCLASRSLPT